jgi:NAD(P)-dependent dehydrogenase (short-subunit alcohol dehydrogenase family)
MAQLEGTIALITGGNSGIGFGTAKRMVEEAAFVYITVGTRRPWTEPRRSSAGTPVPCEPT